MKDWHWQQTKTHVIMQWPGSRTCLSSALLNGGLVNANQVINVNVSGQQTVEAPEITLQRFADQSNYLGTTIGMMTAASMNSLRSCQIEFDEGIIEVLTTCGLTNARRAGDEIDPVDQWLVRPPLGTINSVLITSILFDVASLTELIMIMTEAKCAVMQDLKILSPISNKTATGTGTDSLAIVNGTDKYPPSKKVRWCGKHTTVGLNVAKSLMSTIESSILGSTAQTRSGFTK